jgi:hypothetical protein
MIIEQRKYVRFLAQDNAFATLRIGFKKIGKINDISINGLSFSYLTKTAEAGSDLHDAHVDIFHTGNGIHISNVPCRIVYDIPDPTPDEGLFVKMSRCGLHFQKLTENKSDQLNFFIKNHTIGILSS